MSDKNFKVKNKLVIAGLTNANGVLLAENHAIDSHTNLVTQYGGTGTTTSPTSEQILYSASGTTYAPTTLKTLDVKGSSYSADAPSSPVVGQIWVESDTSSDSFDPNIIRRKTFTATAAQTVFTTDLEFIQGYEQVFFNGMLLLRNSDYTTASNTNVTLAAGAAAGDIVEVVSITNLNSINAATTTTNTFTGAQTIDQTLAINTTIQGSSRLQVNYNTTAGGYPWDNSAMVIRDSRAMTSGVGGGIIFEGNYLTAGGMSAYGGIRGRKSTSTNGDAGGFLDIWSRASGIRFFKVEQLVGSEGTPDMIIDSSGKVGIGTSSISSGYKMSVNGTLNIYENSAGLGRIFFGDPADSNGYIGIYRSTLGPSNHNTYGNGLNFASIDGYVFSTPTAPNYTYGTQTERMRIASDGTLSLQYVDASAPVLYNTANNNNKLMVFEGYAANRWNLWGGHGGNSYFGISENASSTPVFAITGSTNYALIGYTASQGAYKLQVNSQIFATSSSIATSDGRYKENVNTITSGLNIVDSLRPVSFTWKDHPVHNFVAGKTVGFIAQEVKEALSEYDWVDNIIKTNTSDAILDEEGNEVTPSEEFLGIAESNIIPLLVAAVKELKARVETLEANNV